MSRLGDPIKSCGSCTYMSKRSFNFGMGIMAHKCEAEETKSIGVQKHTPCFNGKWQVPSSR